MDAQENRIYVALLIIGLVFGLVVIYFIAHLLQKQKRIIQLHNKNILAEITQIEKERARIAHDLHDELVPLLSAVKMKINSFELTDKDDKIEIEKTNGHLHEILRRVREISFDLMPSTLIRKGIITGVSEYISYLNNQNSTKFKLRCETKFDISVEKSIHIYRIIQEIAQNTIKYAKAPEMNIEFKTVKHDLEIEIKDNGVGFDYEKESVETDGFGLRSLLRRTQILGGQMFVESAPGQGTTYSFNIPL
jgi:signal transduction histidine kinase